MSLEWSESYRTGVRQIDEQHHWLFELLNDLERHLGRGDSVEKMIAVVVGLAAYTKEHFACEEGLMDGCGCPTACVNKMAHQRFIRLVEAKISEMHRGGLRREDFESLHREVEDWLVQHIGRIDQRMKEFAGAV
jgi:hemerythrin